MRAVVTEENSHDLETVLPGLPGPCTLHLLGDEATSTAIIVRPQRDIHQYLVDAGKFGLEIRHVFLDPLPRPRLRCGHLELHTTAATATIPSWCPRKSEYAFVSMKDGGMALEFPGCRVQVLEHRDTPSNRSRSWCSIWRRTSKTSRRPHRRYRVHRRRRPPPTCGLRWVGQPTISSRIFTNHSATNC